MQFDIVANDKATPAMGKVETSMDKFTTGVVSRFTKIAATAAVVIAATKRVFAAMSEAGDISDEAAKLGISGETFQRLKFAAAEYGVSIEQVATALKDVNKLLDEAANKKGPQMEVLRALQFSDADITGRQIKAEEVFQRVAEAIREARTEEEKFAIASRIVGDRVAQSMVPILSDYAEFKRQAEGVKVITDENTAAFDALTNKVNAMGETLKNQSINAIANLAKMIGVLKPEDLAPPTTDTRTPEEIQRARQARDRLLAAAAAKPSGPAESKMAVSNLMEIGGGLARGPSLAIALAERTAVATERTADVLTANPASSPPGSTDITKFNINSGRVIYDNPDIVRNGFGATIEEGRQQAAALR